MTRLDAEFAVSFRYSVYFTSGLFAADNTLLSEVVAASAELPRPVLFTIDRGVLEHHPDLLRLVDAYCLRHAGVLALAGPPVLLPGGESVKSDPKHLAALREAINDAGLCRHSFLVAIGGGAVIDVTGYAAATAHRGIRLLRVPTTVLAQNDSAIGVKNGINAFGKKNWLGTFAPPQAVLNDFDFLTTLSDRDWRAGTSEALKVALIKDAAFFEFIEERAAALVARDMQDMEKLIQRCAELHLRHIAGSGDPFELGSARPLDFGHWAAHKLEQLTSFALRHGEAVAIGIALDATYSYLAGCLPEAAWKRVLATLSALGFRLYVPELSQDLVRSESPRCVLGGLAEFRQHLGGRLTVVLLEEIGRAIELHEIDEAIVKRSIAELRLWNERSTLRGGLPCQPSPLAVP